MELNLKGKVAIITGGGSGVGKAICLELAKEGADIVIADINMDNAYKVVKDCETLGVKAVAIEIDLSDQEKTAGMIEEAEKAIGKPVQILVNNAGFWPTNVVKDIPLKEWYMAIDINLTAVFIACKSFVNSLIDKGINGRILNITSQAAFNGATTGHAHYAAAKSGVVTFSISLAKEVARYGITVNSMALGLVDTPMIAKALADKKDYYESRLPSGRLAQPEEVATLATFLVSDRASYFTGGTYDATGGMLSR